MSAKKVWSAQPDAAKRCADCKAPLPGFYGTPGVAMARTRPGVLLCSKCGVAEALAGVRL
jgi:hypothetical protein